MSNRKLSDLPQFAGQELLLAAQHRGVKIVGASVFNGESAAVSLMLIGLADILVETYPELAEIAKSLPKPPK